MQNYELISDWREIYRNGNKAYKLYSKNKSFEYVTEMARIQSLAYNAGLPVPAVYNVTNIDERIALEMDYIKNESFMQENASTEERTKVLRIMAELQCGINYVNAEDFGLPKFSTLISEEIKRTPYLTEQTKCKIIDLLYRLDAGMTNLCHGDFHGGNVIFDGNKHWVIDWDGAAMGNPAADACMTYFYEKRFNSKFADIYLHSYCESSTIKQNEILDWLPVIAAYQVNIKTESQRNFILSVIDECYDSAK